MTSYTGKTALITGASSGIGAAFARLLAAQGTNLILVARSEDKLRDLATTLSAQHNIRTDVLSADLSRPEAAQKLFEGTQQLGLPIDILINNAGFGTHGPFDSLDAEHEHQEIMLNVAAVVDLTHYFLPAMLARRNGSIINVASTAAFQPTPYMAVYGASKAFILSFSEALWGEYRGKGIRVLALCPGATSTDFFNVVGTEDAALGSKETPEKVVQVALRALEQGRPSVISGRRNALMANSVRFAPRGMVARMGERLMRPGHADKQRNV
ncbi:MAG: SDR family oxidoreductase [Ktedonobacteraceae bacterium]|nr:SDR family oxidoreductase [Ktedonobacteraceae bacterium]